MIFIRCYNIYTCIYPAMGMKKTHDTNIWMHLQPYSHFSSLPNHHWRRSPQIKFEGEKGRNNVLHLMHSQVSMPHGSPITIHGVIDFNLFGIFELAVIWGVNCKYLSHILLEILSNCHFFFCWCLLQFGCLVLLLPVGAVVLFLGQVYAVLHMGLWFDILKSFFGSAFVLFQCYLFVLIGLFPNLKNLNCVAWFWLKEAI